VFGIVLALRRIAMASETGDVAAAARLYAEDRRHAAIAGGTLKAAEAYSLFNPPVRAAHFRALDQLVDMADRGSPKQ
jgi:hypothetical protein